jgi:hypothetical protein
MLRENARVGMTVTFGRGKGEQSLGKITKLNLKTAKIELLENRGRNGHHQPGGLWTVGYSLIHQVDENGNTVQNKPEPLQYNPFEPAWKVGVIQAISALYNDMSPENAHADGERSRSEGNAIMRDCQKKINALCDVLGRNVDESEAYDYCKAREERFKTTA